MSANTDPSGIYLLGHSQIELDRLQSQARFIDPVTRSFFRDAGLAPGMRVLDVGSGASDVAFLVAELVDDSGEVVGVDRSAIAVDLATRRAAAKSLRQVSLLEGDPVPSSRSSGVSTPWSVATFCSFRRILRRCCASWPRI